MRSTQDFVEDQGRRSFLAATGLASGLVLVGCASALPRAVGREESEGSPEEAEVTPGEDLMQEHGVLERILLVYDECARRLEHDEALDLAVVGRIAGVVRDFVEGYHEMLEEEFVFPRLETVRCETELVSVLRNGSSGSCVGSGA